MEALPYGASNAECGGCHADQALDFERSAHTASSPVFEALLPRVETAWGEEARARCVQCHAPSHVPAMGTSPAEPGIACVSCHAAVGNRGTFDGRLVLDLGAPLDGPFEDPEFTPAHASERRGFVSDAASCLTCHEVRGPELFVEPSAMEHREAVERLDAPSCASCHMPARDAGPVAEGANRVRPRRSHRFIGPTPSGDLEAYVADLRALFAGRVDLGLRIEGDEAVVSLANVAMGHALPTGVSFLRELRVELSIDGVSTTVLVLGDRALRGDVEVAVPTDADRLERRRLDPGERREVRVPVAVARHLEARLVFSPYRAALLAELELPASLGPEVVVLRAAVER